MRVAVLGATGVLGRSLLPLLVAQGHDVVGTSRSAERLAAVEAAGATGAVCDAFSLEQVEQVLAQARPEVVVHLMTDLPADWGSLRRGTAATDALRRVATAHLLDAATRAGVRRVVAESIAFLYRPAPGLATEDAPVWLDGPAGLAATCSAVVSMERAVTTTPGLEGVVLRFGTLYGPGTWYADDGDVTRRVRRRQLPVIGSGDGVVSFVHADDAASATAAALTAPVPDGGVLNVVDDDPVAHRDLLPGWAAARGWPAPRHVPAWLARPLAGAAGVAVMTSQRGASNAAAKRYLGWSPGYPSWRDGLVPG